jgi:PRTRC genetic system ThiF family protein
MDPFSEEGLAWANASTFVTRMTDQIQIVLVGCGGTGSWLAPHIGRFLALLRERGKQATGLFVDPDVVEPRNIPRQNFCQAEAEGHLPKALTLAQRYGAAWGVEIGYSLEPFDAKLLHEVYSKLIVLVGCVDNAAGRTVLWKALDLNRHYSDDATPILWLDCGNSEDFGQVLFGNVKTPEALKQGQDASGLCRALPCPAWQHPDLLEPLPEEARPHTLSCAEMAIANAQSLTMNSMVAAVAAEYLKALLLTNSLKCFASYINLPTLSVTSRPITKQALGCFIKPRKE